MNASCDIESGNGMRGGPACGRSRPKALRPAALALCLALLLSPGGWAEGGARGGSTPGGGGSAAGGAGGAGSAAAPKGQAQRDAPLPAPVLARAALSAIVGRPTDTGVTLNLLGDRDQEVFVEYGPLAAAAAGSWASKTATLALRAGLPAELAIAGLAAGTEYGYRLQSRATGQAAFSPGPTGRFVTQRAPGSGFVFEIMGDSHPERPQQFDPGLYVETLSAAAADSPDFFLTIGDDFSVDTLQAITKDSVDGVYQRQRLYLSLVGGGSALFLVNGNHEEASLANLTASADNVAVWAQNARNSLFAQPAPDGFYSGDAEKAVNIGYLRDYYAWTWGDALFVVIDPYWHSKTAVDNVLGGGDKRSDLWEVTLGDEQYAWFRKTLESSKATFKFVFSHHVLGTGRGGIEEAGFYEWGGKSPSGKDEFAARRPSWAEPIQALMARTKVTAFIQGHDHVFASQVLDGVAYLSLPEPADPNYALNNADAYKSGTVLPSSGRVRFTVTPKLVTVEYLRSWLPGDFPAGADAAAASKAAFTLAIPAGGPPGTGFVDPVLGAVSTATIPSGPRTPGTEGDRPARTSGKGGGGKAEGGQAAGGKAAPAAPSVPAAPSGTASILPSGDLDRGSLLEFPGSDSVGIATFFAEDVSYYYEYGTDAASLSSRTQAREAKAGAIARDRITGLSAGTTYAWRLQSRTAGASAFSPGPTGRFTTKRAAGSAFTFVIEADPHFDENSSGRVYEAALARMAADRPDFMIDLGDTAMAEKLASDAATSLARMKLVRSYWDNLGGSAPIFMVAGNHDGEQSWPPVGSPSPAGAKPSGKAITAMRETWLTSAKEAPEASYSVFCGTAYAFEWGDAQFIVLDPFIAEAAKPTEDGWTWTLGKAQYDWLAATLAKSRASFRFVFIHNLVGGKGKDARGGADWSGLFEWGGKSLDGTDGFAARRPGWGLPIAALLAKYDVTAVFHGHDHFYAREEAGGLVYQEVPQPSAAREQPATADFLADNGYSKGDFLPSPGYLRVSIGEGSAKVEYVRSSDGTVAASYELVP
jgi:phosphodiesterase/alkaline phosphatase D-like protein